MRTVWFLVRTNNWRDSQEGQIIASGLAPRDDCESALAGTLAPGNYTAIVRGVENTMGVDLVQAYHVQQPTFRSLDRTFQRDFFRQDGPRTGGFLEPIRRRQ
jgi:hypothetical protein